MRSMDCRCLLLASVATGAILSASSAVQAKSVGENCYDIIAMGGICGDPVYQAIYHDAATKNGEALASTGGEPAASIPPNGPATETPSGFAELSVNDPYFGTKLKAAIDMEIRTFTASKKDDAPGSAIDEEGLQAYLDWLDRYGTGISEADKALNAIKIAYAEAVLDSKKKNSGDVPSALMEQLLNSLAKEGEKLLVGNSTVIVFDPVTKTASTTPTWQPTWSSPIAVVTNAAPPPQSNTVAPQPLPAKKAEGAISPQATPTKKAAMEGTPQAMIAAPAAESTSSAAMALVFSPQEEPSGSSDTGGTGSAPPVFTPGKDLTPVPAPAPQRSIPVLQAPNPQAQAQAQSQTQQTLSLLPTERGQVATDLKATPVFLVVPAGLGEITVTWSQLGQTQTMVVPVPQSSEATAIAVSRVGVAEADTIKVERDFAKEPGDRPDSRHNARERVSDKSAGGSGGGSGGGGTGGETGGEGESEER